jgi:hypothetical protein
MQPSATATDPDDETTRKNFSGHLSAIHALMAISEPTGYSEMTSRKIDSAIEGNLQDKSNAKSDAIKSEKQTAMTDTPRDAAQKSPPIINSMKVDEQQPGKFIIQEFKSDEVYDPYSIFKSLDALPDFGLTKFRKCRYDSCEDEVALVPIDDKLLTRDVVMEDIMYNTSGFCRKHLLGTKKCEFEGCDKCAQGSTKFCIKHGGKVHEQSAALVENVFTV